MVDARLFQALSDPTRLKILLLLSNSPMNVSRMVDQLKCAQPAVSRHLRVLREVSLIHDERKGKEVEYSLNHEQLRDAKLYLEALGGVGGNVEAQGVEVTGAEHQTAAAPAEKEPKRAKAVAMGSRKKAASRKSRVGSGDRPGAGRPGSTAQASTAGTTTTGKPKAVAGVSTIERPEERLEERPGETADYVVEREDESGMDDFLL